MGMTLYFGNQFGITILTITKTGVKNEHKHNDI